MIKRQLRLLKNNFILNFRYVISLLFTLILFAGCTVTKRKYLPGYFVNWQSKTPKEKLNNHSKPNNPVLIILSRPNRHAEMGIEVLKKQKTIGQNVHLSINNHTILVANNYSQEKISFLRSFLKRTYYKQHPSNYGITKENLLTPTNNVTEEDNTKKDVKLAWALGFIGSFCGVFLSLLLFGIAFSGRNLLLLGIIMIMFLPVTLIIISLIHCYKAIKFGHKWLMLLIILLDIVALFIIYFFISAIIL